VSQVHILLLLNGSRERYAGGADKARERAWAGYCSPGTSLDIGYLPSEAESGGLSRAYAFGEGNAMTLAPLYPERCAQAERDGFDAVVIHCCSDPGLEEARARVRIPIVGPGETMLRAAALVGRRIGMTVPSNESMEPHTEQVRRVGLESRLVGIAPINRPLGKYAAQDPRAMTEAVVGAAQYLVERGADVICPSGLAYVPVRVSAREVAERVGVPVLNPALLAVRTAEMLVEALSGSRASVAT
jgi:Asp/Glu/hydantoin racemase